MRVAFGHGAAGGLILRAGNGFDDGDTHRGPAVFRIGVSEYPRQVKERHAADGECLTSQIVAISLLSVVCGDAIEAG